MKVVILDESTKRSQSVAEKLEARGHSAVACRATGDFMDVVTAQSPGKVLIDADSWKRGGAIFRHFAFGRNLSGIPVVIYNATESFSSIPERPRHDEDIILHRGAEVDMIVDGV